MVKGMSRKNSMLKPSQLQPLTLLEIIYEEKPHRQLYFLKEARNYFLSYKAQNNVIISGIILFITEVLNHSIKEEEANPQLFDFIEKIIIKLESIEENIAFLPIWFLIRLSSFLGITPLNNYTSETITFNMEEGKFQESFPERNVYITGENVEILSLLIKAFSASDYFVPNIQISDKSVIIDILLQYYHQHLPGFSEIHTHKILKEILYY